MPFPLISTHELAVGLDAPDLRIVDASWRMEGTRPGDDDPRIPGAVRFDIDAVADRFSPLPHMLPSPQDFAAAVGAMGIAHDDRIVVYDERGLFRGAGLVDFPHHGGAAGAGPGRRPAQMDGRRAFGGNGNRAPFAADRLQRRL